MKTIIFVHGTTKQKDRSGYSDKFKKMLSKELLESALFLEYEYSSLSQSKQSDMARRYNQHKGRIAKAIGWVLFNFGMDAIAYERSKEVILYDLEKKIRKIDSDEIIFICHSLGASVVYDWFVQYRQKGQKFRVYSMGANLDLFHFDQRAKLSYRNLVWYNYYEKNDVLGLPVSDYFEETTVIDQEWKDRNWFTGWNLTTHTKYFSSRRLAKEITRSINNPVFD